VIPQPVRRSLGRLLLVFASFCCGIVLVELGWSLLPPLTLAETDHTRRYMLFGGGAGSAFENVGRFFLYRPASVIRAAAYFDTAVGLVQEYEYEFHTNNLGLVQKDNVVAGAPSVLILGDSFTEGQGAEPWFERVAPFFVARNHQPINGGLLGTGFSQWILLHEHLRARNIVIKKLIVVLISDDYERPIWNFSTQVLNCLSSYLNCMGDEEFYGMPPDSLRHAFLEKLRHYQNSKAARRRLLPATTLAYGKVRHHSAEAREWLNLRLRQPQEPVAAADDPSGARHVSFFADLYGKDVVFVHLPVLTELHDGPEEPGIAARAAIRESGAKFFDGFSRCGLTVSDYYAYDGHPNAAGYAKIADCVREAAKEIM